MRRGAGFRQAALCAWAVSCAAWLAIAAPAAGGAADVTTEEGLRTLLDAAEARYESACVKLNEARWSARNGAPGAEAVRAARSEMASVLGDAALAHALAYWDGRKTVTRDPSLTRRVKVWNHVELAASIDLDPAIADLSDALAARMAGFTYTLQGRTVTLSDLRATLAQSPDPAARREAWRALAALGEAVKPDVKKLIRMRAVKAQATKSGFFHHLNYAANDLDPAWVFDLTEHLVRRTRPAYLKLYESMKTALHKERLEMWDLDYGLTRLSAERGAKAAAESAYRPGGAEEAAGRLLESLGFERSARPAVTAAPPGTLDTFALGVRIPGDVRVMAGGSSAGLADSTGAAGAERAYEMLFAAYGASLPLMLTRQQQPILKGYDCFAGGRNAPYAEGMAEAMAAFLRDGLFLRRVLGVDAKSADLLAADARDRGLIRFRWMLLDAGAEFTFYVNPDADLDARYRELVRRSFDVEPGPDDPAWWPGDSRLVTQPLWAIDRLVGLTIAAELHQRLREAFGDDRLGSHKAAAWLTDRFYAPGESLPLPERLAKSLDGGNNFDLYLETLGIARVKAPSP